MPKDNPFEHPLMVPLVLAAIMVFIIACTKFNGHRYEIDGAGGLFSVSTTYWGWSENRRPMRLGKVDRDPPPIAPETIWYVKTPRGWSPAYEEDDWGPSEP